MGDYIKCQVVAYRRLKIIENLSPVRVVAAYKRGFALGKFGILEKMAATSSHPFLVGSSVSSCSFSFANLKIYAVFQLVPH